MNVIVVVDENWAIGNDGDQLVYIPADLKRFQALTTGHTVLLGRKTLATFPGGKPLKNRENIILSSCEGLEIQGAQVVKTIDDAVSRANADTFVIGGASVYRQMLPYCKTAYVTKIHKAYPQADTYFPDLDATDEWEVTEQEGVFSHEDITFSYLTYRRKG